MNLVWFDVRNYYIELVELCWQSDQTQKLVAYKKNLEVLFQNVTSYKALELSTLLPKLLSVSFFAIHFHMDRNHFFISGNCANYSYTSTDMS